MSSRFLFPSTSGVARLYPPAPSENVRIWVVMLVMLVVLTATAGAMAQSADDFTIVVLPDMQNYSQFYPQIFDAQTQWIAKNVASQNIRLVIGEGDLVNTATDPVQWQNVEHSIGILEQADLPYVLAIGNHDYDSNPPTTRKATIFNQHFGPSRFYGRDYYGSTNYPAGSNENFYATFTWGSKSYLILVLEFVPRSSAVAWAASVLNANQDKEVIVVTHSYLFYDGTTVDACDTQDMSKDNNGALLWTNLLSRYPNVSVVVGGHIAKNFRARRSDVGVDGNFVHQFFANWQDWTNGGNGYLRIMKFSPSLNKLSVWTYSPYTGLYLTTSADQFTLKWHNNGAPGSGLATVRGRVRSTRASGCTPISGASANINGATAVTDASGTYAINLRPGSGLTAAVTASGWNRQQQTVTLNDYFPNQVDFFLTPVVSMPCPQSSTDPSVTICSPLNGATVVSPVKVVAGTHSSAPVKYMEIWLDGKKVYVLNNQPKLSTSINMTPGLHRLTVNAFSNTLAKQSVNFSVAAVSPPCNLNTADPSVTICAPAPNSTVTSPVGIVAGTTDSTSTVTNMFIWVDGVKQWTGVGGTISTTLPMAAGTRRLTVQAKDLAGRYFQSSIYVKVQ